MFVCLRSAAIRHLAVSIDTDHTYYVFIFRSNALIQKIAMQWYKQNNVKQQKPLAPFICVYMYNVCKRVTTVDSNNNKTEKLYNKNPRPKVVN